MIERWLQITCDGCGHTESGTTPNESISDFRKDFSPVWKQRKGGLDYCRDCVKAGHHKTGFTIFDVEKTE